MNLFERAAQFAVEAHKGQVRKRAGVPAILHPMEVASICSTITTEQEVLAAALLHDTVEDTSVTMEDILATFGPRVAELVASETEDKRPELPAAETWRIRKEESLAALAETDDKDVYTLWLGDKLSNMRSFARLHNKEGMDLWKRFNQNDPEQQHWYYRKVAELTSSLSHTEAWKEYDRLVAEVFEEVRG